MIVSRTQAAIETHLHYDLACIVHDYLGRHPRTDRQCARLGHWELCMQIKNVNCGLVGACRGGHRELANLMITHGANDWDYGLYHACRGGHRELADMMIVRGANDWNWGLYGACYSGHRELVDLMIAHGANDWNDGLYCACDGGHRELIELMIAHGATRCRYCNQPMTMHVPL